MLGGLYLFLCFSVGWAICSYAFPGLSKITETAYDKRKISVSSYLFTMPAWFVVGTIALTWTTYLIAFVFAWTNNPLVIANAVTIPIAVFGSASVFYLKRKKQRGNTYSQSNKLISKWELILISAVTILAAVLMWTTFYIKGDQLYIGVTVFSDFSPHIGMIRSFSYGNNFPTEYPHFAGEDIKYHFMFQFLVGNLEFLGLRLDYAFNIPSILSFISAFLLLYILAVKITTKVSAGILACIFFAFRSSKTLFTYLAEQPAGTNLWKVLMKNTNFIADTPNEDWGLWNLNVYANQRHLAFGFAGVFFVIILLLPHLYEMFESIKQLSFHKNGQKKNHYHSSFYQSFLDKGKVLFFKKDAWVIRDLKLSIACGMVLGSLSFFNGAAVIGGLFILFVIAILSRRRLEFLIVAGITIILAFLQTKLFIDGNAVTTKFMFGFIAEHKTLLGVVSYLERLLGILPFVLIAAFCMEKGIGRHLMLAFIAPLILAFTVSLTTDVTVNHKYIMLSCILLSVFAAALIAKMLERRDFLLRFVGVILTIMLTSTGIYDFNTILKKNTADNAIVLDLEHPLTEWINLHSDSKDIFLTSNYSINQVVLGGAMLYQGWQYYAWSAGYDTVYRDRMVKWMYEAQTPTELNTLVKENKIRYIIVGRDNRGSEYYTLNEDNIKETYQCVYEAGEGEWKTSIYDTQQPIFE